MSNYRINQTSFSFHCSALERRGALPQANFQAYQSTHASKQPYSLRIITRTRRPPVFWQIHKASFHWIIVNVLNLLNHHVNSLNKLRVCDNDFFGFRFGQYWQPIHCCTGQEMRCNLVGDFVARSTRCSDSDCLRSMEAGASTSRSGAEHRNEKRIHAFRICDFLNLNALARCCPPAGCFCNPQKPA